MSLLKIVSLVRAFMRKTLPEPPVISVYILEDTLEPVRREKCDGKNRKCHYMLEDVAGTVLKYPGYKCDCSFFCCQDCAKPCWEDEEDGNAMSCFMCKHYGGDFEGSDSDPNEWG